MSQLCNQNCRRPPARVVESAAPLRRNFAAEGAGVVCVSRTQENSEKVANEIGALGKKAWAFAVDVAGFRRRQRCRRENSYRKLARWTFL